MTVLWLMDTSPHPNLGTKCSQRIYEKNSHSGFEDSVPSPGKSLNSWIMNIAFKASFWHVLSSNLTFLVWRREITSNIFAEHWKKENDVRRLPLLLIITSCIHQALNALFIIHELKDFSRKISKCLKEQVEPLSRILFGSTQIFNNFP